MAAQQDHQPLLGRVLEETARAMPDKEALVFGDQRVSWYDFDERVDRFAKALLDLGVERGDRIGVFMTTRPEYEYAYLAAAKVGAVLVGLNVQYKGPELAYLFELTQPKVLIAQGRFRDVAMAEALKPLVGQFSSLEHFIVVGEGRPDGALSFEDLVADPRPELDAELDTRHAQVDAGDGVLIVFTSGSTGRPKAALLTHRNILDNIAVETRMWNITADDRLLLHLPMNHVGGATELTVPALLTGATLVMMDHFHPVHTLETIQHEKITLLGQVPTMYIMEFNLPHYDQFDLSSLRAAVVAGAPMPASAMQQMAAMAPEPYTGYGMTEVAGFVTYTLRGDPLDRLVNTVGKAAPEWDIRAVDDERRPLPAGEVGEIAIRGSCVMKEYLNNPEETAQALDADGWFYSGDLGYIDEDGYITLVGRKKDMYITGGFNVYPREIEEYLEKHPAIALVAVLGTPDPVMGEVGTAYVIPRPGAELTEEEFKAYCAEGLAEYKIPRHLIVREALPLTALGKVDKRKLREQLGMG